MSAKSRKNDTPKTKSRRAFGLASLVLLSVAIWSFSHFYVHDENGTRISARPVPARPHIEESWLSLPPAERWPQTAIVRQGDNLMSILTARGIASVQADAALDALRTIYDPRSLKVGQKIRIFYRRPPHATEKDAAIFDGLDLIPAPTERVIVRHMGADGFQAFAAHRPLTDKPFLTDTRITSSLYEAARASGMAPRLVLELIKIFSFTIDFQREIRAGDRLEVLYTRRFDQNGKIADEGRILFAALTIKGKRSAYWHFDEQDMEDFYNAQGQSITRLLMKTPLDGARLTSRFGLRKHPILGYTKLHRGVDFGARRGTPIFAAGDGRITALGVAGDQGKRIKLVHQLGYETLYAHLSRYAKSLKVGDIVRQGQIIGYVGATGLATGPHLHYEVSQNGQSLDPLKLNLPPQRLLPENQMPSFTQWRTDLNGLITDLSAGLEK